MINDDERFGVLPTEFRFAHLFCQRMSDRLVDIHRHLVSGPFWEVAIHFRSEADEQEFSALEDSDVIGWLEANEYSDPIGEIMMKRFLVGILGDLCQFVYEGLGSSTRGKTGVAFALFRKPLKDSLFYLEWMLADPGEMLTAMFNNDAKHLALHSVAQETTVIKTTTDAMKNLLWECELDPEFIWQLRFNKKADFSLEHYWQRALHLITHQEHVKTSPRSMNFVFHDDEDRQRDWVSLYSSVPVLLFYMVEVCEALVVMATKAPMGDYWPTWMHRGAGLVLYGLERQRFVENVEPAEDRVRELNLLCRCGFRFDSEQLVRRFYYDKVVQCPDCARQNTAKSFLRNQDSVSDQEKST